MSKLGIFGGTFNPIHTAHLIIANTALEQYSLDRIMFLPNYQPPHKECDAMAEASVRFEMIQKAISSNPAFFACDYEINKGGLSYTVDTLKAFEEMYADDELYFIIGGDSVECFHLWYEPLEIAKRCKLLAYPRHARDLTESIAALKSRFNAEIYKLDAPEFDISSSYIRDCVKNGKSVKYLVPDSVLEIIEKNHLYKG